MTKLIADIRSDIGRFRTGQDDTLNVENILDLCAEHEQLLVELAHRVGWEERCLDAEAAAARLERQNAELAREAIGMKAAWMNVRAEVAHLKPVVDAAMAFRGARILMMSEGWKAHRHEADALEALMKSIIALCEERPT